MDVAWAAFPEDYSRTVSATFDPGDMTRLFEIGADHGRRGTCWTTTPPTRLQRR
jgi:hypothetical protein